MTSASRPPSPLDRVRVRAVDGVISGSARSLDGAGVGEQPGVLEVDRVLCRHDIAELHQRWDEQREAPEDDGPEKA